MFYSVLKYMLQLANDSIDFSPRLHILFAKTEALQADLWGATAIFTRVSNRDWHS